MICPNCIGKKLFTALLCAGCALLCVVRAAAAPFAYVGNQGSSSISVIDIATPATVVATIPLGTNVAPGDIAIDPRANRAYVATNAASAAMVGIDTKTNTIIASVPAGGAFSFIAVNPVASFAYMGTSGGSSVTVVNTATNTVVATVPIAAGGGGISGIAVHPAGTFAYIAGRDGSVSVIDASTNTVTARITLPSGANTPISLAIAVNRLGTLVYVPYQAGVSGGIAIIDTATNTVTTTITDPSIPTSIAINPASPVAYVAHRFSNSVSVINLNTNAIATTLTVDNDPSEIAVSPLGDLIYVTHGNSFGVSTATNKVSVISASSLTVLSQAIVGANPVGIATGAAIMAPDALSGLWWNSSESGWGIHFTQRRNIVFAAWYTYDASGNPKWYVATCTLPSTGGTSGTCSGTLQEVNGPTFFGPPFDPSAVHTTTAGSLTVSFTDANNASMTYTVGSQTRTVSITRQPLAVGSAPAVDHTDLWWNPAQSGWGMAMTQQAGTMFLAWYVYDGTGNPVWYVATCPVNSAGNGCAGTLYRTTGPALGPTFNPALVHAIASGTVTLRFIDQNTANLDYTVGSATGTVAITRQLF